MSRSLSIFLTLLCFLLAGVFPAHGKLVFPRSADEADEAGKTKTYHYDQAGSTIARTDDAGRVIGRAEYSAYGLVAWKDSDMKTPFLFNGQAGVTTEASGLLCMRARYYSPYLMRFVNADPSGFGGGNNWYAYADGNPVSNTDPFGLCAEGSESSWLGRAWDFVVQDAKYVDSITGGPQYRQVRQSYLDWTASNRAASPAWVRNSMNLMDETGGVGIGVPIGSFSAVDSLVTVRTYTNTLGRAGITGSGALRADTWVTLPEEIPSQAGHLQIEKLLEIEPGRGSYFLEFETPASNLSIPANGPRTSGNALQFQLNNPVPIDPTTFRRPPGRPGG